MLQSVSCYCSCFWLFQKFLVHSVEASSSIQSTRHARSDFVGAWKSAAGARSGVKKCLDDETKGSRPLSRYILIRSEKDVAAGYVACGPVGASAGGHGPAT